MFAPEQIKRILIIRLAPLGETVLTTPVIRALRQHFQDAHIAYMVAPTREDLVSANPHLNEVLTYQSSVPKLIYHLAQRKFQMAVVLQPTFRLVLHTFLARIPFRVGFETNTGGKSLLHVAVPNNTAQHEIQRYLDVVRALGIEVVDNEPEVFVDDASKAWGNNFLENQNLNDSKHIIGLNPGAATSYRRWSAENFAMLGDMLHEAYDTHIVITAGPQEGELAYQVAQQMKYSPVVANNITPMQLAALLQRCHLYISNDTGPMHLSTAVKTPTIALFGGSNPTQWGPMWDRHTVIAREGCELMKTLSPKEWDEHADVARQNLNAIKPEMVFGATEKMKWKTQKM
ncbi:MAG: glycosyltransferase family 9 protein [Candidatus Poribacteria bacterium]|nr:glycosyltransferase family 9 protein [Candidatus Poribacteria bacterium]